VPSDSARWLRLARAHEMLPVPMSMTPIEETLSMTDEEKTKVLTVNAVRCDTDHNNVHVSFFVVITYVVVYCCTPIA
jgi:hypothetical protein